MRTDTTLTRPAAMLPPEAASAGGGPETTAEDPIFAVIAEYRTAVASRMAADRQWDEAGEPHSGPLYDASDAGCGHEHDVMAKMFRTFPTTSAGAAALFERLAEQLYAGEGDFTVMQHALELWETDEGLRQAKEWVVGMGAALRRIATIA
jgi:hypothetical protein